MTSPFAAAALSIAIATLVAVPVANAKPKHAKRSPAHDAAVQRCTETYEAAAAAAHAPNSPTGKTRLRTMHAAAEARKACVAKAPQ
jgi:hypothetical protein